jgi:PAS domain S-box-containing protein
MAPDDRAVMRRDSQKAAADAVSSALTEERLRAAIDSLPDGLVILDEEDRIVFYNARYPQHLMPHLRSRLAIGERFFRMLEEAAAEAPIYHADMGPDFLERRLELHRVPHVEHEQHVIDGRWFRIRESRSPDGGRVLVTTDITARKQAAEALKASEARYRAVVETQTELITRTMPDGRLTFVNEAFCRYMQKSREALLDPSWDDFSVILPEHRVRHRAALSAMTHENPNVSIELRCHNPDGRIHDEAWNLSGIFDAEGTLVELQCVGRDMTEMRRAIQALAESEASYRAVIEDQTEVVARFDAELRLVFCNTANARLLGCTPEAAKGSEMFAGTAPALASRLRAEARALTREKPIHRGENEKILPDGTRRWFAFTNRALFDGEGQLLGYQVVGHDITEQKVAAAALAESEQRLRSVVEAHPVPMTIVRRLDDRLLFANRAHVETFGYDLQALQELDLSSLYAKPADRTRLNRLLRKKGEVANLEIVLRRRDGSMFPASLTARPVSYLGEPAAVLSVVDMTALKAAEAEIARHREALHQSEKLGALGSLLAGVAHELNNPLSIVTGYAGMLRDQARDTGTRQRAERIAKAAERCARIVRTFLALARSEPRAPEAVRLAEVVDAALELAAYGLRSADIAVDYRTAPDLPEVWGDADQLHQVLSNLIVNAQQAMLETPAPRRLEIEVRQVADRVELSVADSGPGLPEAIRPRIFDPFFTTKPVGVGTGVGLSVSRGIAEAHRGSLECRNRAGGGAVFTLTLPVASDGVGAADVTPRTIPPAALRVLVVDDEPDVLAMLADLLGREGHRVVTARSGREALARLDSQPIDLIISDLRMPDLDGRALHRLLQERRPELARRLIFLSGDVLGSRGGGVPGDSTVPLVEKPVDMIQLLQAIANRLGTAARDAGAGEAQP